MLVERINSLPSFRLPARMAQVSGGASRASPLIIYIVLMDYYIAGLTAGAPKG